MVAESSIRAELPLLEHLALTQLSIEQCQNCVSVTELGDPAGISCSTLGVVCGWNVNVV